MSEFDSPIKIRSLSLCVLRHITAARKVELDGTAWALHWRFIWFRKATVTLQWSCGFFIQRRLSPVFLFTTKAVNARGTPLLSWTLHKLKD